MEDAPTLVVHGHFYQPPRENPWTEEVAREPTAAPFHDWNERITAECYRPNGVARILDDAGRVVSIVNNFERMSFDVGPTLMSWLEIHDEEAYARIIQADALGGGGIAQAYGHLILPLADERDIRTQVRWGLADFAHRFGRQATGLWLPECAVDDTVLRILAEEGVRFTILAPGQASGPVEPGRPYRWEDSGHSLTIVFYDGGLSHDVAFGLGTMTSQAFIDRAVAADRVVAVAADGETFGHHHHWGDRLLAYALEIEAPHRGVAVANVAAIVAEREPEERVAITTSSWSCAHGVERWRDDCGCSTGGEPGWNQRWRRPLREALDLLRDRARAVFEERGSAVMRSAWTARDEYIDVLLGRRTRGEFAAEHIIGDEVEAFSLLESQRHAMSMYTSCGWFFNDLAGIETIQVLRYAARLIDLLDEIGADARASDFLDLLSKAESNIPAEGNGRDIWFRHVVPSRVDGARVAAHIALMDLLQRRSPPPRVGAFDVRVVDHGLADRGGLALCTGQVELTHLRTGRRTGHVYGALHLGGLEVLGASRAAASDDALEASRINAARESFADGASVTSLVRMVSDEFGPREFGLESAMPDAAEHVLGSAARALADRFVAAYERLFDDHRATLLALADAGYPLPAELRAPGELALARRLEVEVAAQAGSLDPGDYATAIAVARQARAGGLSIDTPRARATVGRLLVEATRQAVEGGPVEPAIAVLEVAAEIALHLDVDRAQELVYSTLRTGEVSPEMRRLAVALGLAVD